MGIRRRRKKLNTVLTSVDRRLRQVELRRVPKIVKDGTITRAKLSPDLKAIVDKSDENNKVTDKSGTGTIAPTFVQKPYVNVVKVEYRGYNLDNLDDDAATVYFDVDPGINIGDTIKLASFTPLLDKPGKTTNYVVTASGLFESMYYIRYLPGRQEVQRAALTLNKGVRLLASNCGVADAVVNGSTTVYKSGTITYAGAAGTDDDVVNGPVWPGGTYVTTGQRFTDYDYAVGDLINIDGLGDPFDGPHLVTARTVTGANVTLKFSFATPQAGPVTLPTTNGSLRGAVSRLLRNGETYTDTSVEPAVTYIWDETLQKWWNMADTTLPGDLVIDDGIAPKPPTSVGGTSEGYVSGGPKSSVSLTWTAPTQNVDNTTLIDLVGYKVYYKYASATGAYTFASDVKTASAKILGLPSDTPLKFVVTAYDKTKNESAYSTEFAITTAKGALELDVTSKPQVSTRLGNITVTWDGKSNLGADMSGSKSLSSIRVYRGTIASFVPDPANYIGGFGQGQFSYIDSKVDYGVTYYYKIIPVDAFGNAAAASDASDGIAPARLVDTDLITDTLTTWPFLGQVVSASALADGSVSASALANNAITASNINNVFEADAVRANIASFGGLGADEIAAGAIVAGKIAADAVTADVIAAGTIEAGNIKANTITADQISTGYIYAGVIDAGQINAGTITGRTLQTADAASSTVTTAVIVNGADNSIDFKVSGLINFRMAAGFGVSPTWQGTDGLLLDYKDSTTLSTSALYMQDKYMELTAGGDWGHALVLDAASGDTALRGSDVTIVATNSAGSGHGITFGETGSESYIFFNKLNASLWYSTNGGYMDPGGSLVLTSASTTTLFLSRRTTDGTIAAFHRGGASAVGSISVTSSATAYNTSSDYRLKENVIPLSGALGRVMQLKPSRFNFILEPERTVDGFIAHEVQEVIPEAIYGVKDALNEDGTPNYQGIDQSKLVPLLTAALQEAVNKIEELSDRITTLEG